MDSQLYPKLTGVPQKYPLDFLNILEERGITTWIRHVVVPGLTDDDEWLDKLGAYVAKFNCVERMEILPYHTLGIYKYEQLGLDYPLKDTEPLAAERAKEEKERALQKATLMLQSKYGKNAVLKGMNLMQGAMTIERNGQIGGHSAGGEQK